MNRKDIDNLFKFFYWEFDMQKCGEIFFGVNCFDLDETSIERKNIENLWEVFTDKCKHNVNSFWKVLGEDEQEKVIKAVNNYIARQLTGVNK